MQRCVGAARANMLTVSTQPAISITLPSLLGLCTGHTQTHKPQHRELLPLSHLTTFLFQFKVFYLSLEKLFEANEFAHKYTYTINIKQSKHEGVRKDFNVCSCSTAQRLTLCQKCIYLIFLPMIIIAWKCDSVMLDYIQRCKVSGACPAQRLTAGPNVINWVKCSI